MKQATSIRVLFCIAIILVGASTSEGAAFAAEPEPGSLEWFQEIWKQATEWQLPTLVKLDYQTKYKETVNQDLIQQLIDDGAEEESHPNHFQLQQMRLRQKNPETFSKYSVILLPAGWRIDREWTGELVSQENQWETIAEGESRWELGPGRLLVTDKSEPLEHFGFDNEAATIEAELRKHIWFGMGNGSGSSWSLWPKESTLNPVGVWKGVVESSDSKIRKIFHGYIDENGKLTVSSSKVIVATGEYEYAIGQEWRFDEPAPGGSLGVDQIQKRVKWIAPVSGLESERTLVSVSSLSLDDTSLLEPPIDGHDALRGDVDVDFLREVNDNREVRSVVEQSGNIRVVNEDAGRWWRKNKSFPLSLLGWLAAGTVVVLVITIKYITSRN